MKHSIFRWTALVIATAINIQFSLIAVIFLGANLINDFQIGDKSDLSLSESLFILGYVLCIVANVIAWFKSKIGGILITLFAILLIILPESLTLSEKLWQPYVLIAAGLLLFYYALYNKSPVEKPI